MLLGDSCEREKARDIFSIRTSHFLILVLVVRHVLLGGLIEMEHAIGLVV